MKCDEYCIGYNQIQNIYALSNMPKKYQYALPLSAPDDDYDAYIYLNEFKDKVEEHIEKGHGLFIHSKTKGNGKTSWACKIMNEYFRRVAMNNNLRCRGCFVNVPKFLDMLRDDMNAETRSESLLELREHIMTADLVIWDDIGTENPSKWVRQTLYKYINHREAEEKSQIFTSNVSLGDLVRDEYLGERVVDRIRGQCHQIEFIGSGKREASW